MPLHKHSALSSAQTLLTTALDSLANAAISAASTAFANSGSANRHLFGTFELVVSFGTAPSAGKTVDLYLLPTLDGTNFVDGGGSAAPGGASYVGSFVVRGVTGAQRLALPNLPLPATDFKALLINNAGQTFAASGNTLKLVAHSYETA